MEKRIKVRIQSVSNIKPTSLIYKQSVYRQQDSPLNQKNQAIISTLIKALEHSPNQQPIRIHIGKLCYEDGEFAEALNHFQHVLDENPLDLDALKGAVQCSIQLKDDTLAQSYQVLLDSQKETTNSDSIPNISESNEETPHKPQKLKLVSGGGDATINNVIEIQTKNEITLEDVAGLESVKKRLDLSFLSPIRNPQMAAKYNIKVSSGLLLYGPPGCGKTHIARALAGEVNANFMSIGIDEILDMWIGSSERNLAAVYQEARLKAPSVIFFDEMDALGHKRSGVNSSAVQNTVNQLLLELDGIKSDNDGVFTLAATNLPWKVDSALRRPGRFDRSIFVSPPDTIARKRLFQIYLKDRPMKDLDLDYFAKNTRLFSAADIRQICDHAAEFCMEQAMMEGQEVFITNQVLKHALKENNSSIIEWFNTAKNFVAFSSGNAAYDDVADYMRKHKLM